MKVKDLIAQLQREDPEAVVVMALDAEENSFSPLKLIPDNVIMERAAALESSATAHIEHLVSQVNAKLSHLRLSVIPVSASNFDKVESTLRILERMLDVVD